MIIKVACIQGRKGAYPGCRGAGLGVSKISKAEVTGELPLEGWSEGRTGNRERACVPRK